MATSLHLNPASSGLATFTERWFFTGMAAVMLILSIAGFAPAILMPQGRRAPVSPLAALHGTVFSFG